MTKKTPEFSCITRTLVIEPIFFILKHSIFYKPIKIKNVKNFDKSKKHRDSNCQLELIRINQGHVCDFLGYFEAILRLQVQLRASINLNLFISKPKFEFQISQPPNMAQKWFTDGFKFSGEKKQFVILLHGLQVVIIFVIQENSGVFLDTLQPFSMSHKISEKYASGCQINILNILI